MTKTNKNTALAVAIALALAGSRHTARTRSNSAMRTASTAPWNTTLSYGISLRTEDPSGTMSPRRVYNPLVGLLPNAQQRAAKGAFSANHDDGDLNYKVRQRVLERGEGDDRTARQLRRKPRRIFARELFLRLRELRQRQTHQARRRSSRPSRPHPRRVPVRQLQHRRSSGHGPPRQAGGELGRKHVHPGRHQRRQSGGRVAIARGRRGTERSAAAGEHGLGFVQHHRSFLGRRRRTCSNSRRPIPIRPARISRRTISRRSAARTRRCRSA